MIFTAVVLVLIVPLLRCDAAGLTDNPIEADSIVYLDGTWNATLLSANNCSFEANTDYRSVHGDGDVSGHSMNSTTKEECCGLCLAEDSCVVGVQSGGTCWIN